MTRREREYDEWEWEELMREREEGEEKEEEERSPTGKVCQTDQSRCCPVTASYIWLLVTSCDARRRVSCKSCRLQVSENEKPKIEMEAQKIPLFFESPLTFIVKHFRPFDSILSTDKMRFCRFRFGNPLPQVSLSIKQQLMHAICRIERFQFVRWFEFFSSQKIRYNSLPESDGRRWERIEGKSSPHLILVRSYSRWEKVTTFHSFFSSFGALARDAQSYMLISKGFNHQIYRFTSIQTTISFF